MEPRTPPRSSRHRAGPATPATPRFGAFEDETDLHLHRKASAAHSFSPQSKPHNQSLSTPITHHSGKHRRKRSIHAPFTPKQTPKKRRDLHTNSTETSRAVRPALRIPSVAEAKEIAEEEETDVCDETDDNEDVHSDLMSQFSQGSSIVKDNTQSATNSEYESAGPKHPASSSQPISLLSKAYHPHQPQPPPDVPGIWYVFRGKKIFRPLPPGEERPQPVTLFEDDLRRIQKREAGQDPSESETDSDVEWQGNEN